MSVTQDFEFGVPQRTSRPRSLQLLASAAGAAVIVGLMFVGMNELIRIKEIVINEDAARVIDPFTPQKVTTEPNRTSRRVEKIEAAVPPPPAKRSNVATDSPVFNAVVINTPAPELGPARVNFNDFKMGSASVMSRRPEPVTRPLPSFPQSLLERGISGTCEVTFNVNVRGEPYDIRPVCTHAGFEAEARRSVGKAKFMPGIDKNGTPQELTNAVWPLEFVIAK